MFARPFNLSLDEFLKGEGKAADDLDIIDEIDGTFVETIGDVLITDNIKRGVASSKGKRIFLTIPLPKIFAPIDNKIITTKYGVYTSTGLWHYRKTETGVILLGPNSGIEGFYANSVVSVNDEHRGKGLGTELIVVASIIHGINPSWSDGKPQYTPSGLTVHQKAYRSYRRFPDRFSLNIQEIESEHNIW